MNGYSGDPAITYEEFRAAEKIEEAARKAEEKARKDAGFFWCRGDALLHGIVKVINGEEEIHPIADATVRKELDPEGRGGVAITPENVAEYIRFTVENYPIYQLFEYYAGQIDDPTLLLGPADDTIATISK